MDYLSETSIISEQRARDEVEQYANGIKKEFSKISRSNLLNAALKRVFYVELYFGQVKAADTNPCFYTYTHDANGPVASINKVINESVEHFIKEGYYTTYSEEQAKKGDNSLSQNLSSAIKDELNKRFIESEFWCGGNSFESSSDIFRHPELYSISMMLLQFDRSFLESAFRNADHRHMYLQRIETEWENSSNDYDKLCFNELFRKASLVNRFLYMYEDDMNLLSLMEYEGNNNQGSIITFQDINKNFEQTKQECNIEIEFSEIILLNQGNYKKIRKLLEICEKNRSLLMRENGEIFGIGSTKNVNSCYKVIFKETNHWVLYKKGKKYLEFVNLIPCFPEEPNRMNNQDVMLLKQTFNAKNVDKLLDIVNHALNQEHGTMVVFSENAKKEAERLKESDIRITPTEVVGELVEAATSIDGAMICDDCGICYAIGAILDGRASKHADSSRGARYNSAIRYIEQQKRRHAKTFIVIVSEDKYITCLSTEKSLSQA